MYCSALLILHEAHTLKETNMAVIFNNENRAKEAADMVARSREAIPESSDQRPMESCVKEASPFLTTLLYHVAVAILRIYRKEGSHESLEKLIVMKAALRDFDQRWRASGEILSLSGALILNKCRSVPRNPGGSRNFSIAMITDPQEMFEFDSLTD